MIKMGWVSLGGILVGHGTDVTGYGTDDLVPLSPEQASSRWLQFEAGSAAHHELARKVIRRNPDT